MKTKQYKIKNTVTGLFSKGGSYNNGTSLYGWSKKGKVWTSEGALRNHLNLYVGREYVSNGYLSSEKVFECKIPIEWEVIELWMDLESGESGFSTKGAIDFYMEGKGEASIWMKKNKAGIAQ